MEKNEQIIGIKKYCTEIENHLQKNVYLEEEDILILEDIKAELVRLSLKLNNKIKR